MSTDERILDAALRVFLEEGPRAATTRRIAAEAGVNEVTLFRRFGTKDQLLIAAMRQNVLAASAPPADPPADPAEALIAWTVWHARRMNEKRGLMHVMIETLHRNPELRARAHEGPLQIRANLAAWFGRLRVSGRARGDWEPEYVARMLLGALMGEIMRPDANSVCPALVADGHVNYHPGPSPVEPNPELDAAAAAYARLTLRAIGVLPVETP